MKLIKITLMAASFMLISATAQAQAAPECVSPTQEAELDYSSGTGRLCIPGFLSDNPPTPILSSKTISCTVNFFDDAGVSIGSETVTGVPNSLRSFSVPRDGIGSVVANCTLDALVSINKTVIVTFPVIAAPTAPVIMP